jgi:hypothetical protein
VCVSPNIIESCKGHLKQLLDISDLKFTELAPSFLNIFVAVLKILGFLFGIWARGFFFHSFPEIELVARSIDLCLIFIHELSNINLTISS